MTQYLPEELIEIRKLYQEAAKTITSEDDFDISADQVGLKLNQDEVLLLYEIAAESLSDDGIRYVDTIFVSEQKKVESSSITKALQSFEDTIQRSFFTLKKAPDTKSDHENSLYDQKQQLKNPYILVPMSWADSLFSFIFDSTIVFLISALVAYMLLPTIPDVWTSMLGNEQYLYYFPGAFGLYPLVALAYIMTFALCESPTIGLALFNCNIVNAKGNAVSRLTLVYRAAIAPISYLLLGVLCPLLGQVRIHDILMGTKIVRQMPKTAYKRGKS